MKIVVIGAGAMGLSAGRVLAERGHQVQVLDTYGVSHALGSSAGASRLWRLAHLESKMVHLAQQSVELWRELERRSSSELLLSRGLLVRGDGASSAASAVQSQGSVMELLTPTELARMFPELAPDNRRPVFWQPEAGVLLAAKSLAAQLNVLVEEGGRLFASERVTSIEEVDNGVRVDTEVGSRMADVVVLAAGPWSGSMLKSIGVEIELSPVLEQICYFGGPGGDRGWESRPCFYDWGDQFDPLRKYCMPTPGMGYKVGIDHQVRGFDIGDLDRSPSVERTKQIQAVVTTDFPGLEPVSRLAEVCTYTNSADDHFILDRVGNVVIGCGDSGQAFKFSPLIGEFLADLAEGRPHPAPELFGLGRLKPVTPGCG